MVIIRKSLNRYSSHAPKREWIDEYFKYKNEFLENHSLGSAMIMRFKTFLKDSRLSDEKYHFSKTAELIEKIGLRNETSWAILFVNLSFKSQINWFVKNVGFDKTYSRDEIEKKLFDSDEKNKIIMGHIRLCFGRFCDLPFSEVGLGTMTKVKGYNIEIMRKRWINPDPLIILYAIYRYSECQNFKRFTLSDLIEPNQEVKGANVGEIFGIDRETFKRMLLEMSLNYPEFINASFTNDLNSIVLREDKTSDDVLQFLKVNVVLSKLSSFSKEEKGYIRSQISCRRK